MFQRIVRGLELTLVLFILALITGYSNPSITQETEKVRVYTRQIEFNYLSWMSNATLIKLRSASIGAPYMFDHTARKQIVAEYLRLTQQISEKEYQLEQIYADAKIADKKLASEALRAGLAKNYARQAELAPFAEAILQEQVSQVLADSGLTDNGSACAQCLVSLHTAANGSGDFSTQSH